MNGERPHLIAAVSAILLFIGVLVGFDFYARSTEDRYVGALKPNLSPHVDVGSALQRAAFQKPNLLVVYGSSEMRDPKTDYKAFVFSKPYPGGFTVVNIARDGVTSLILLQNVAAIGPDLKGKKVVISFTPYMFQRHETNKHYYAGNFSHLRANELIFSPSLSMELKQAVARRMLDYPDTLEKTPLLNYELGNLYSSDLPYYRLMYSLAWPLGELETLAIELQDHAAVLVFLQSHHRSQVDAPRAVAAVDWAAEIRSARQYQIAHSANNRFGIEQDHWKQYKSMVRPGTRPGSSDAGFVGNLRNSKEWVDFDLMLRVLTELGAKPLLLGRPLNGALSNALGISAKAQSMFYDKLETEAAAHKIPLVDFRQQTDNIYFSIDEYSHSSREGWLYVDQALDAFYHNRLH